MDNSNSKGKLNSTVKIHIVFLFAPLSMWLVKFIVINMTIANGTYF